MNALKLSIFLWHNNQWSVNEEMSNVYEKDTSVQGHSLIRHKNKLDLISYNYDQMDIMYSYSCKCLHHAFVFILQIIFF